MTTTKSLQATAEEIDREVSKQYRELGGKDKKIDYSQLQLQVIVSYGFQGEGIREVKSLVSRIAARRRTEYKKRKNWN